MQTSLIQRVPWLHTTGREIERNLLNIVYSLASRCVRAKSSLLTYILRASLLGHLTSTLKIGS